MLMRTAPVVSVIQMSDAAEGNDFENTSEGSSKEQRWPWNQRIKVIVELCYMRECHRGEKAVGSAAAANLTDKLQSVMNAAARIVCGLKKYDHITSHMRDSLHWLRVPQRVTFKLCLLTYKSLHPQLCTRLSDGTLQSGCTIGTEAPLAISYSRRSDHPENNNIVRRPGLRTRWTSCME